MLNILLKSPNDVLAELKESFSRSMKDYAGGKPVNRKKEVILQRIIEFYIDSPKLIGIPHWQLHAEVGGNIQDVNTLLEELLIERRINLKYSDKDSSTDRDEASPYEHIETLKSWKSKNIEVYPAKSSLEAVINEEYKEQPFSIMAFLGKSLLTPVFFKMDVLEYYFQNPEFIIEHGDYQGSLSRKGSRQAERPYSILPSFGLGYKEDGERVLTVYLQNLFKMSARHQQRWQGFRVEDQCRVAFEYHQEMIKGEKAEYRSIFEAFLAELYHINRMTDIIYGKTLFANDFAGTRPADFKTIFRPTRNNYFRFLKVLQKLMPDNLNTAFFADYHTVFEKGSEASISNIQLFEQWLKDNIQISHQEDFDVIFEPFHKANALHGDEEMLSGNDYSKDIFKYQNQWMVESYNGVKMLRLLFANHPSLKNYDVPDWLLLGKVTIY